MSIEAIGKQIASLRKEKGARQEELAKYVGVSAQAVSKWENGGVPDIELLPKIADFFSVSIDSLFNRNISDSNLQSALMKKISKTPNGQKIKTAFNLCWDIERRLCHIRNILMITILRITKKRLAGKNNAIHRCCAMKGLHLWGLPIYVNIFFLSQIPTTQMTLTSKGWITPPFSRICQTKNFSMPVFF